jgi:hypothetical protein
MTTTAGQGKESSTGGAIDAGQVARWLRLFVEPGQVTELRAVKVRQRYGRPQTVAGFFDGGHLEEMAALALELSGQAKGVYFVLNPVKDALLARICNRVCVVGEDETTKDCDIRRRRWLPIDADPKRVAGVSSTEAEKAKALEVVRAVREDLHSRGWPAPVLGDSGNGYHLLYAVDLPADDGGMVRRVLQALASRFDTDAAAIDQKVFNPARIWKLFGTSSCKGDSTPDRPHRQSRILEIP